MDILDQLHYVTSQIKKLRVRQGVSQMELSLRANLSQSFLANLENGKKQPSVLTIIKIADALDLHPKEFFPQNAAVTDKQEIKEKIVNLLEYL
jgi:transcriptional regulator with XRE-family HTH domain